MLVKRYQHIQLSQNGLSNIILNKHADFWIKRLKLEEHPEGGYYAETYRSDMMVDLPGYDGARSIWSLIYYLLVGNQFASFHLMKSEEIWHFYSGSSLTIHLIDSKGALTETVLGPNSKDGEKFQVLVKSNCWFAASINDKKSYTLVGCTVSPGFDYRDWKLGNRKTLIKIYPRHTNIIEKYTRDP